MVSQQPTDHRSLSRSQVVDLPTMIFPIHREDAVLLFRVCPVNEYNKSSKYNSSGATGKADGVILVYVIYTYI